MEDENPHGDDPDRKVGYGRPPKHSRFKPGESGNPKGRPSGSRNLRTDVKRALKKPVTFVENGKRRKTSTQEAVILKLREKALKGDTRALDMLMDLAARYNDEPSPPAADESLSAEDEAIIADYLARKVPAPVNDSPPALLQPGGEPNPDKKKAGHNSRPPT